MDSFTNMFSFINVAIGAFAIYSAITGKGPAFKNDYPESIKEDCNKLLRKVCWVVGPLLLVEGILEYLGYAFAVYFIIPVFITIGVYLYIFFKKYGKIARGK